MPPSLLKPPDINLAHLELLRWMIGLFQPSPSKRREAFGPLGTREAMLAVSHVYPKYMLPVGGTKAAVSIGGEKKLLLSQTWFKKMFATLAGQWRELEIDPYFWLAFSIMEYMGNTVPLEFARKVGAHPADWPEGLDWYEDNPDDKRDWNDPILLPSRGENSTKVTFEFAHGHGVSGVQVFDAIEQGFFFTPDAQRLLKARYLAANPKASTQPFNNSLPLYKTNVTGYNIAAKQPGFVEKYRPPVVSEGQDPERGMFFEMRQWGFELGKVSDEDRNYQSFVLLRQHQRRVLQLMRTKDPCECRNCNDSNLRPKPRHPRTYGNVPWALQLILGHGLLPYIYKFGLRSEGEMKRVKVTQTALTEQERLIASLKKAKDNELKKAKDEQDDRFLLSPTRAENALSLMRANLNKTILVPKALVGDATGVLGKDEPMYGFTMADFIRYLSGHKALAQIIPRNSNMDITQQVKAHFAKVNRTYGY